ncbi:hypothetical protein H4S07_001250 [Coemansia furcata]|uniref:Uncharacterized protein n=1 Tax=Coemansia furcata TaxID=417177 RepID=A0ACC1LPU5_9FUNG|nr:hypothetical protein H4S07_001250 [Coemansia furcata]
MLLLIMKSFFAAIICLAVAVLAQTNPMPVSDAAAYPVANVAVGQTPQMTSSLTQTLLSHLGSYFDMSHVSSVDTATPVIVTHVFDPTMDKFTHLSMNVVQSGDAWYLPVCTIDSITAGGSAVATTSPESCQFAIQLAPVPQNAMKMIMKVIRAKFRAIEAASREPTRYLFGCPSTGMTYMPEE